MTVSDLIELLSRCEDSRNTEVLAIREGESLLEYGIEISDVTYQLKIANGLDSVENRMYLVLE